MITIFSQRKLNLQLAFRQLNEKVGYIRLPAFWNIVIVKIHLSTSLERHCPGLSTNKPKENKNYL